MGTLLGIISIVITCIAFIPMLGWLNWFAIPISVVCLIISLIIGSSNGKILCLISIIIGLVRLLLGGGII